jgi:hypothetical protein
MVREDYTFSYLFICNPTNKTETGTPNRWGDYLPNSKPSGPIIMMGQSETAAVRSYLLHSFLEANTELCLLQFLHPIALSTPGDALMYHKSSETDCFAKEQYATCK